MTAVIAYHPLIYLLYDPTMFSAVTEMISNLRVAKKYVKKL
jgi:hypothetical protein